MAPDPDRRSGDHEVAETQSPRCLLLISADMGLDTARVAAGTAPRRDYLELSTLLGAQVVHAGQARNWLSGRLPFATFGRDLAIVLAALPRLKDCDVIFSDNERTGALVAAILRTRTHRPRHVLLAHHLTPGKKRPFLRLARPAIDTLIVHVETQRDFAIANLSFASESVVTLPYQVDTQFWSALPEMPQEGMICSAGLEYRDYDTLLLAAQALDVSLQIGAVSNWSSKKNALSATRLPPSVEVGSYTYIQLRELYARSRFVVVPLLENSFQAGITLILEAMAAGKALIVSRTAGQTGVVRGPLWREWDEDWPAETMPIDAATGLYVLPGDVTGLRSAMRFLLRHPDVSEHLGKNGRVLAQREYTVERYAERFAAVITGATTHAAGVGERTLRDEAGHPWGGVRH